MLHNKESYAICRMSHNGSLYIVQLQTVRLLNLQCNVPLTRGPSAIAEPLVQYYCQQHRCR